MNASVDQYVRSATYVDAFSCRLHPGWLRHHCEAVRSLWGDSGQHTGWWHDHNGAGDYLDFIGGGQANDDKEFKDSGDNIRYFTRDGKKNVTAAV